MLWFKSVREKVYFKKGAAARGSYEFRQRNGQTEGGSFVTDSSCLTTATGKPITDKLDEWNCLYYFLRCSLPTPSLGVRHRGNIKVAKCVPADFILLSAGVRYGTGKRTCG